MAPWDINSIHGSEAAYGEQYDILYRDQLLLELMA
jgi:hypothetical protein